MALFFYALLAGLSSILSPCFLPVLFVGLALATGTVTTRAKAFFAAFVLSFAGIGSFLIANGALFGISARIWHIVASLALLGVAFWIWKHGMKNSTPTGLIGGAALGIVWTPCSGIVTKTMLTIAVSGQFTFASFVLFLFYAVGVVLTLLVCTLLIDAYVRGYAEKHNLPRWLNPLLLILVAVVALLMIFNLDGIIYGALLPIFPFSFLTL